MNAARKSLAVAQILGRNLSQSAARSSQEVASSRFLPLKETQKKFQVDDGVPIYLKAGLKDKVMFQGTLVLLAVGLCMSVSVLYKLSAPKSN